MENAKVIAKTVYDDGESIVDVEHYFYSILDDIPTDKDGFTVGTIKIVVTHIP